MFTDDGILMLLDAQVEVAAYIDIHTQRIAGLQVRALFP